MVSLSGLEKFSHLEDKIYRTIELTKSLRQEKETLEQEIGQIRRDIGRAQASAAAEPHPADLASVGGVRLGEVAEQLREPVGVDTLARVADRDAHRIVARTRGAQGDRSSGSGFGAGQVCIQAARFPIQPSHRSDYE